MAEMDSNERTSCDVHIHSDAILSMSNQDDSNRSDEGIVVPWENKRPPPGGEEEGGGVPIATPASTDNNNIRSRLMASAPLPPPPMTTNNASNHISPATPMPPPFPIASSKAAATSAQSQESRTLASLYQSSRRSRNNTPRTPGAATAMTTAQIPPPPLFTAPSSDVINKSFTLSSQQLGDIGGSGASATPDVHKVSLQSSGTSFHLHESWNTSMSSLFNSSYINTSLSNNAHNCRSSHASQGHSAVAADFHPPLQSRHLQHSPPNLMDYKMEDDEDRRSPCMMPTVPNLRDSDQSPESASSVGCIGEFSSLQVRTREEFELRRDIGDGVFKENVDSVADDEDNAFENKRDIQASSSEDDKGENGSQEPPKKRNKMKNSVSDKPEEHYLTPETPKSCTSSASFDIIAQPSSHVSSIHDDTGAPFTAADVEELLETDVNVADLCEVDAGKDHDMGVLQMKDEDEQEQGMDSEIPPAAGPRDQIHHAQEPKESRDGRKETPTKKEQRILRRKIQRLLLIRHCTTCSVPPLPLAPSDRCGPCDDDGEALPRDGVACPVTSHCAEGKALCAHIRTCKLGDCEYKKCLTSREVLGHYKTCRDAACEICGPVRALDRRHCRGPPGRDRRRRRASDCSSIETIDDEGWLNANMMDGDDRVGDVPNVQLGSVI